MKFTGSNEVLNLYIDRSEAAILRRAYKSRSANEDDPVYKSHADDKHSVALYQDEDEDNGIARIEDVPDGRSFIIPGLSVDSTIHVVADIVENLLVYKERVNKAEDQKKIEELIGLIAAKSARRIATRSTLDISRVL